MPPAVRSRSGSLVRQDLGALTLSQLRITQCESAAAASSIVEPSLRLQDAEWYWGNISRYLDYYINVYINSIVDIKK